MSSVWDATDRVLNNNWIADLHFPIYENYDKYERVTSCLKQHETKGLCVAHPIRIDLFIQQSITIWNTLTEVLWLCSFIQHY